MFCWLLQGLDFFGRNFLSCLGAVCFDREREEKLRRVYLVASNIFYGRAESERGKKVFCVSSSQRRDKLELENVRQAKGPRRAIKVLSTFIIWKRWWRERGIIFCIESALESVIHSKLLALFDVNESMCR
jgi:hypothetical protein